MIAWAIETLFASTLLMILVLVARAPVRKWVGPQIAYALWALPVLRMLLPPMPATMRPDIVPLGAAADPGTIMMGVPVIEVSALPQGSGLGDMAVMLVGMPVIKVPPLSQGWGLGDLPLFLLMIWIAGALAFAAYHIISYIRFSARLRGGARSRAELAQGRVAMIESDAAAGPLAFGVWRKYVAFPVDFSERYDELERDLALAHELGHHARGDLFANWIGLAVLSIHWFNPVAWRAFRAFRADQEMACDALVLSGRHSALRHAYGRAIVKSAHGVAVSAACHLHTVNEIKGRLRMLTRHQRPSFALRSAGGAGIVALTLTALAFTASGTTAAEGLKAKVEDKTGVSIDAIELPALPVAVEPPAPVEPMQAVAPPAAPAAPRPLAWDRHDRVDHDRIEADARRLAADAERRAAEVGRHAAEAERIAASVRVPEVREGNCGGQGPSSYVVRSADGRSVATTVICTDRIERDVKQAQLAERMAMVSERSAMASKRQGLAIASASIRNARAGILANRYMSDEDRREALADLEDALREVRAEAHAD